MSVTVSLSPDTVARCPPTVQQTLNIRPQLALTEALTLDLPPTVS